MRESKRHTARHVASARFADEGVPHPALDGDTPGFPNHRSGWGVPHPVLDGRVPGVPPIPGLKGGG